MKMKPSLLSKAEKFKWMEIKWLFSYDDGYQTHSLNELHSQL